MTDADRKTTAKPYRAYCVGGRWYVKNESTNTRARCSSREQALRIVARGNELHGR